MKSAGYILFFSKALTCAMLLASVLSARVAADTLNIAVASNFTPTLKLIQSEFEAISGHTLQLISGSSGAHYAQIVNGAPFDLFLSADTERPEALQKAGLIGPDQRRIYAFGRLSLWSKDNKLAENLDVLSRLKPEQRLAIANPRLAPYGVAAEEFMQYQGIYDALKGHVVTGESVGQAFQFVFSGSAVLGLVAYSQVLTAPVAGSFSLIPDAAYTPIAQEMVLLRSSGAAQALFEFLSSPIMIPILEQNGYYAPQGREGGR